MAEQVAPDVSNVADTLVHDRLLEILGAGSTAEVDLVRRMVWGFDAKASRLLAELDDALRCARSAAAARAAHTLKGTALNLGLPELARVSQIVEDAVATAETSEYVAVGRALLDELVGDAKVVLQRVGTAVLTELPEQS